MISKRPNPKQRAKEVLVRFQISNTPIDVTGIADRLGIAVRELVLEDELSGMIFLQDNPVIAVNARHHINRKRFTIAHEIGHFVLHSDDIGNDVHVDKKFLALARGPTPPHGFDQKEVEANSFAAELLVPRDFLRERLQGTIIDIEDEFLIRDLAKSFQVSQQMMSFRVAELVESQFR